MSSIIRSVLVVILGILAFCILISLFKNDYKDFVVNIIGMVSLYGIFRIIESFIKYYNLIFPDNTRSK